VDNIGCAKNGAIGFLVEYKFISSRYDLNNGGRHHTIMFDYRNIPCIFSIYGVIYQYLLPDEYFGWKSFAFYFCEGAKPDLIVKMDKSEQKVMKRWIESINKKEEEDPIPLNTTMLDRIGWEVSKVKDSSLCGISLIQNHISQIYLSCNILDNDASHFLSQLPYLKCITLNASCDLDQPIDLSSLESLVQLNIRFPDISKFSWNGCCEEIGNITNLRVISLAGGIYESILY